MVFLVGQAVFYHCEDINIFLNTVHGTNNDLLKAVSMDCKEILFLAGCKTLGLISKFLTAQLWRLIEMPGNILDINGQYFTLTSFLDEAAIDEGITAQFMLGEKTPFDSIIDNSDKVLTKLLENNDKIDEIVQPLLQNLFLAIQQLLERMIPEHLAGGRFWEPSQSLMEDVQSAKKHNKSPEFIFGQYLMAYRPNASVLANEAYLMYAFNKTGQWLKDMSNEERARLLASSIKEGKDSRRKFKERLKTISEKRLIAQRKKQQEMERLEIARMKKAEDLTNDICDYGLWQSHDQIEEGMSRLINEKEIVECLHAQLKFRRTVLKQTYKDKKVFNLSSKQQSGKYKKISISELKDNLLALVKSAASVPTKENS